MSDADVFVGLTLRGDFDPKTVTERLGIDPTREQSRGQVMRSTGRAAANSVWSVDSQSSVEADVIEPHLEWLLDLIEPRAATLSALVAERAFAYADCTWSSAGMSGGPWITPESMGRLTALKLPLIVSFYATDAPRT